MNKLRVGMSPLTGSIFAGRLLKSGMWAQGKQDVTLDCLVAVAQHVAQHTERFGKPVLISKEDGTPEYEITVKKLI